MLKMKHKKSEKTRQLIIEKAAILFNQKGFHGTSMSDIIEATQLSKGCIYGNFKKNSADKKGVKEEIALAAFEHAVLKVQYDIGKRTRVISHALDKLKTVVYYYKENILHPPVEGGCPIQNTSIDSDDSIPALSKKAIKALDNWKERIIYTLEKGIEKGEVRADIEPEKFAVLFIGTLEGGIMLANLYKNYEHFNIMSEQLLKMIEDCRKI